MPRPMHVAGAALLLLLGLAGCREQPPVQQAAVRPVPVVAEPARRVDRQDPVGAIGRLESSEEMRLAFKSPGVVARLHVDIGDAVVPGQLLAELETTELDAALTRAREALVKTERDLARASELERRKLVSSEVLDNARTARDVAAADLDAAVFNRRFAEMRATASGRVLARHVEPREVVAAGTPVLSLSADTQGWLLRVHVTDSEVVRLVAGAGAELHFDALPEHSLPARVSRIAGQADPATATFEVELALEHADARLRSGMIAHAYIDTRAEGEALLVPLEALVEAGDGTARLYVAVDGHARMRSVQTGRLRSDGITVLDGLPPGEAVIVQGAAYVDEGTPVRLVPREG